jgi:hypothetical protein
MQVKGVYKNKDVHMRPGGVPSAEEYQEWLDRPSNRGRRHYLVEPHREITGAKLRRVAIMRKQGETWTDCARAIGLRNGSSAKVYFEFMPEHLQP